MSDASSVISQQFKDGGVIPAHLPGQNATSKDYVDNQDEKIESKADKVQADINNHLVSRSAHAAENITYNGNALGNNVKQAIDNTHKRINGIISQSGNDISEIVDARGSYDVLGDRLNASDAELSKKAIKSWYDVKEYGAKHNTDSTSAIQSAINDCSENGGGEVRISAGIYLISSKLTSPLGVSIVGDGKCELHAIANIDAIIDLAGSIKNVHVNGNNMASKGIQLTRDYCYVERCILDYCEYGIYNTHDVHKFINCSFQNCTYGLYSADRFINSFIYGMIAQNNQYGIYVTYADQQPQSLFITHSLFFGNALRGIHIEKDIFVLCITDCVFDGPQQRAIMLKDLPDSLGADITIKNNFIAGSEVPVWIGAGYSHVIIDNNRIDNGSYYGLNITASETLRTTDVTISNNSFGNNASGDMQVDSVRGCVIEKNLFGVVSGTNIVSVGTFSGEKYPILIKENTFAAPNRVSNYNTILRDNIGFKTNKEAIGAVGNGFTTVNVAHELDITPNFVSITPYGDLGYVWVTNITSTQFTLHCSKAASGDTQFYWRAE